MPDSPLLTLPYLAAAQAQKHVTHNEALSIIDGLVHLAVVSRSIVLPPATPAAGDRYLIPAGATGDWATHVDQITLRMEGAWRYFTPREGWAIWVSDEDTTLTFNGSAWVAGGAPTSLQNLTMLGVNATADAINKLSVNSSAILFNNIGSGVQLKFNKNAAADTASMLFQTGFSGRAEIGTTGDDDFHFKVSANGSAFSESLVIAGGTGLATFKNNLLLEPQAADPVTPSNGQLWYNSTTGKFRARQNGANIDLGGASGGGGQSAIQFQEEGANLGAAGTIDTFNVKGDTIVASRAGNVLTLESKAYKRNARWAAGGATTVTAADAAALAVTGTATAAASAATNNYTQLARVEYLVTTAAATAIAGWRFSTALWWRGNAAGLGGFRFRCRWGNATGASTATSRAFIGMTNSVSAPADVEPSTLTNMIGMGWDAADANVQILVNDGTGLATKIDLGASFPVPTADRSEFFDIELLCEPNATSITYRVTRGTTGAVATGTLSADLPANNLFMSPRGWISVGGTSSVIGIALMFAEVGADY